MSCQSEITKQIDDRRAELESLGLYVFEGERAQEILQRLCYLEDVPVLYVVCERDAGLPPVAYHNFIPVDYKAHVRDRMFEVKGEAMGSQHSVYFHPDRSYGATGDIVTFVAARIEGFPEDELENFPEAILESDSALPVRVKPVK